MSAHLLWITLFIGATGATALGQTVAFQKRAARTGDQSTRITDSEMNMKISMIMGGTVLQEVDSGQKQHRELIVKVRDADDDGAKSVSFQITAERNTIQSAVEQTTEGELVGDLYLVTRGAGGAPATVTSGDGSAVDDATAALVRNEANPSSTRDLFDPTAAIGEAIPPEATVGEPIHVDRERALQIFVGASNVEVMTLTLRSVEGKGAEQYGVFEVVMRFSIFDPTLGTRVAVDLTGTASVLTANSWLRSKDLKGPLTISGGNEQIQMKGTGMVLLKSSSTFTR